MGKKWYELFVTVDKPAADAASGEAKAGAGKDGPPGLTAAQTVAEIASSIAPPQFAGPVRDPASFDEIYTAAEIATPAHGYTIFKVGEMLQSEHIRNQPTDVKRSSILLALEAAGVRVEEVIQDAVRRDRALDTYERVQQKALDELCARMAEQNRQIQAEMDRLVTEHRARMQANTDETTREKERIYGWQLRKQQEEQRIADAVAPFVSENPITTGGAAAAPRPTPAPKEPGKQP